MQQKPVSTSDLSTGTTLTIIFFTQMVIKLKFMKWL